uniref:DAGKc domain-containing protein n=1 Tax=Heterorhabditis bacteriophora TaxID=37862 RepID=A0A1I7WWY3_HETBA
MDIYEEFVVAFFFIVVTSLVIFGFRKLLENRKRKSVNDASLSKSRFLVTLTQTDFVVCVMSCAVVVWGYKIFGVLGLYVFYSMEQEKDAQHIIFKLGWYLFCFNIGVYRCIRVVHTHCRLKVPEICDLGELRLSLILPQSVITRKSGNRNQRMVCYICCLDSFMYTVFQINCLIFDIVQPVIESLTSIDIDGWRPIIVIINPKSGSGSGKAILKAFRSYLHPVQVLLYLLNIIFSNSMGRSGGVVSSVLR